MKRLLSMNTHLTLPWWRFRAGLERSFRFLRREPHGAVVLTRHGQEVAVLISVAEFEHLKGLEDRAEEAWLINSAKDTDEDPDEGGHTLEEIRAFLEKGEL